MIMHTYRNFTCPNGHEGEEKTTENDQPYSQMWERVDTTGMVEVREDGAQHSIYKCSICGERMNPVVN
jgi:hypothetical protein